MRNEHSVKQSIWFAIVGYTLVFAALEGVVYSQFIMRGITLIWNADALGQYYPAFLYIGQYWRTFLSNLFSGTFALPAFDLSIGMGEDVIGVLNYYGFGDPINILALFATKANGSAIYAFSYFLRLWLGGLAFLYYCRRMGLHRWPAVLGALIYVMSGWTMAGGLRYVSWGSALIYTPLMMAGAEEIIRKTGQYLLFVLAVAYGALCGFYFLYMGSLALGVYCLIRIGCVYGGRNGQSYRIIAQLLILYILAIAIASPVFYPAVKAFLHSARSTSAGNAMTTWGLYRPSLQRIRDFLMLSVKPGNFNYMLGILPVEYFVIVLYLFRSRRARKRQIVVALGVAVIAVLLPISDWLFNGFAESNLRWVYILHFLAAVTFVTALSDEQMFPVIVTRSSVGEVVVGALIWCVSLGNILYNGWMVYNEQGVGWIAEFCTEEQVVDYVNTPTDAARLSEYDELYRIANDTFREITGRPENLGMINDYHGLTYWFSIINSNTQSYVDEVNGSKLSYRSHGLNHDAYVEALAGCKYYISSDEIDDVAYELDHIYEDASGQLWYLYRNSYYIGMAYCISDSDPTHDVKDITEAYSRERYSHIESDSVMALDYDASHNVCNITVNCNAESRLVLAFPYSSEWQVYVDGAKVNIEMFGMYLSVRLNEGAHVIEYRYSSVARQICVMVSIVLILGIALDQIKFNRRQIGECV